MQQRPDDSDLNGLILRADEAAKPRKTQPNPTQSIFRVTWPLVIVTSIAALALWLWFFNMGKVSSSQISDDLDYLLLDARNKIDIETRRNGHLPEQIGDATLALVVTYHIVDADSTPPRYTLTAEIAGKKKQWPTTN